LLDQRRIDRRFFGKPIVLRALLSADQVSGFPRHKITAGNKKTATEDKSERKSPHNLILFL
jgi:hypothetical protein